MPRQDDPNLTGEIVFYRRIPPDGDRVQWENDVAIPSSQNFRDKDDELSVYLATETTPQAVLEGHNGFGLVSFTAADAREVFVGKSIAICRDDEDPRNGHVLICGKMSTGMARKLREKVRWVENRLPIRLEPDEWGRPR